MDYIGIRNNQKLWIGLYNQIIVDVNQYIVDGLNL